MLAESRIPSTVRAGTPRCWAKLRTESPGGCEARLRAIANHIVAAADMFELDPWLLAAMAFHESRFNAGAVGPDSERGVFQLSPRRRDVRDLAFMHDAKYRERCLEHEVDGCQGPVIRHAASILRRALEQCLSPNAAPTDIACALSVYNSGKPDSDRGVKYAARVIRTRDRFAKGGSA